MLFRSERGWSRDTPAAVIVDAWTETQQVWRGTLEALAADCLEIDRSGAGTIVIGDVVSVAMESTDLGSASLVGERRRSAESLALRESGEAYVSRR